MTTHNWIPNAAGFILDSANYTDGLPFQPGDTLVINSGSPNAGAAAGGGIGTLTTGTYDFWVSAALLGLTFQDVELTNGSNMFVTGPDRSMRRLWIRPSTPAPLLSAPRPPPVR
jgi:hypothetical protein